MKKQKIFTKNNLLLVEAAISAGCTHFFGYPITPQNEIIEGFAAHFADEDGVFLQAESEISAINMVAGCGSTGARVLISSSGPGISLMQECLSFMVCAEIPCVVVNVMRAGPGDGDIKGSQGDYFQATRGGGHGDYYHPVFAPAYGNEIFTIVKRSFDLAFKYRTPVIILIDGLLGQMIEPANKPAQTKFTENIDPTTWAVTGCKGRQPNNIKSYFNNTEECEEFNDYLQKKFHTIIANEYDYETMETDDAELILVAFGIMARICKTVVKIAREEGLKVGLIRPITLWPFPNKAFQKIKAGNLLVVEQNAGQMLQDVKLSINDAIKVYFHGRLGGAVPSEHDILSAVKKILS